MRNVCWRGARRWTKTRNDCRRGAHRWTKQEMIAGEQFADGQTQEMYAGEWFADGLVYCRWGRMLMVSMPPKGVMWAKASAGEMARA